MRRLIRRWLYGDTVSGSSGLSYPTLPSTEGRAPTALVQRISNGFLVVHNDSVTFCMALEELPGLVAAAFALDKLGPKQLDLFGYRQADATLFNRPFNQPIV